MAKASSNTFDVLLRKLLSDQLAIQTAVEACSDLAVYSKPVNVINRILEEAPELRVFKNDNISVEQYKEILLESVIQRETIYQAHNSTNPTKKRRADLEYKLTEFRSSFVDRIIRDTKNPIPYLEILRKVLNMVDGPQPLPTINQSLYIMAFANFETFLASLLSEAYLKSDALLFDATDTYSWKQILGRGSVQKLRAQAVEKKIAELLRRSMSEWITWFEKKARLKLASDFKEHCIDMYDLRNLFAHEKSSTSMRMNVVSADHVLGANEVLFKLAVELICALLKTFGKEFDSDRAALSAAVTPLTLELLQRKRFGAVVSLGRPILAVTKAEIPETTVNVWIAQKMRGNHASFREEVVRWDAQALGSRFVLAKYALLGDKSRARRLAKTLLEAGELSPVEWLTWPLFDEVRGRALQKANN